MIEAAFNWLKTNLRPACLEVGAKHFIRMSEYNEVRPDILSSAWTRTPQGDSVHLATIEALISSIAFLRKANQLTGPCRVIVTKAGVRAMLNPELEARLDDFKAMSKTLYVDFQMPASKQFAYEDLIRFFDEYKGKVADEATLRASLKVIKIFQRDDATIEDQGAFVVVKTKGEKGVEGAATKIPKEITITMPTGTREFEIPNRFLFRVSLQGPSFNLLKIENDGSWEKLLEQVTGRLTKALPDDLILEGV